jgi:hypothetical protein
MLPTAISRKLTLPLMCALLMGMSLLLTTPPHIAFARTPSSPAASPITVERAFTADANGREKSTFAPGASIRYAALISNSSGRPTDIILAVVSAGPLEQKDYKPIYENGRVITVQPGRSTQYFDSTIPKGAMSGTYAAAAGVDSNLDNKIESYNWGTFTVT